MVPSRDEAIAQLERVLASDLFATTTRLSRFLRFVSERSLAGESERLKEYVIGIEVFDRDERYDPRLDSIVRVEAGRLRTKLDQYYNGPGREDEILIRLQKGSYAPSFEWRATERATHESPQVAIAPILRAADDLHARHDERRDDHRGDQRDDQRDERRAEAASPSRLGGPPSRGESSRRRWILVAATVVVLGIAAIVIVTNLWRSTPPADAVAVLPFEPSTASPDASLIAVRLTEGVTAELVRTGRFSVVPSRDARASGNEGSVQSIARRLKASWLLEARVMHSATALHVEARMMNPARNRKLWVDSFDGSADELDDLSRRIGAAAATALERHLLSEAAERKLPAPE